MRYRSAWTDGHVIDLWTVEEVGWQELSWLFDLLRAASGR